MELLCPAGSMPALRAAIEEGADAVFLGLKGDTNARQFAGLNFDNSRLEQAVSYVHNAGKHIHLALNTFAHPSGWQRWQYAVDEAAQSGVDALILADLSLLQYARDKYPHLRLHLSVQAAASNAAAIRFYYQQFGVERVVLPRVLTIRQIRQLAQELKDIPVGLEVFAFGSLCIMAEGRCFLSSWVTGESPNTVGACSPAGFVRWEQKGQSLESRLGGKLLDRYQPGELAGYPTLCKGRYQVDGDITHALEEPVSLDTLSLLPQLAQAGVCSFKIEGRQRSPAYVRKVTRIWRQALDNYRQNPERYQVQPQWEQSLALLAEGARTTTGAYERQWQ